MNAVEMKYLTIIRMFFVLLMVFTAAIGQLSRRIEENLFDSFFFEYF